MPNRPAGKSAGVVALAHLSRGVLEKDIRKHGAIGLVRQVRAEADPHIERCVEVQDDRRSELRHRFALQADKDGDGIAALFDSDALGADIGEHAPETVLHVLKVRTSFRTLCEVDHPDTVLAEHGFLGIVIQVLANHQERLAVAIAFGIRERHVGSQRNVAGDLLPEIAELIALVPDVVSGGVDGVLFRTGIVAGAAGSKRGADVGLALKHADRRIEIPARPVEIRGRRYLSVRGGTRQRPIGYDGRWIRRRAGRLCAQMRRRTHRQQEQRGSKGTGNRTANRVVFQGRQHKKRRVKTGLRHRAPSISCTKNCRRGQVLAMVIMIGVWSCSTKKFFTPLSVAAPRIPAMFNTPLPTSRKAPAGTVSLNWTGMPSGLFLTCNNGTRPEERFSMSTGSCPAT